MIADVGAQLGLAYAFVEREIALSKRYWAWEIVWLVYGVVTSLSVAYIALGAPGLTGGSSDPALISRFVLYLLVGTITWRFLGLIFEQMGETIAWERWEGTIEYTFMAPVPRLTHLLGMCAATLVRALGFSVAILAAVALFVPVDLSHANVASALVLLATGALAVISPATYVIQGMRDALLDGADFARIWPNLWPALVVGAISIPVGLRLFL